MKKGGLVGQQEILVLAAIMNLADNAYGVSIQSEIETKTQRKMSTASIYLVLTRLTEKGFVKTRMGQATKLRGGRRKCFYDVTAKGKKEFRETLRSLMPMIAPYVSQWGMTE